VKTLAGYPEALPWLRDRLRLPEPEELKRIARLLKQLDAEEFADREKASRELEKLGRLVVQPLREALAGDLPPEARRRAQDIVDALVRDDPAERLRGLRLAEALERAGTPAAAKLLESLRGHDAEDVRQEARLGLERLRRLGLLPQP
jgi:hypothetical protein